MFNNLNANKFQLRPQVQLTEFQILLRKIVECYNLMIQDKIVLPNNENLIRDKLLDDYLKNDAIRNKLEMLEFHFEKEITEEKGRVDIKIITKNTFISQKAYYIIECKRLDNKNTAGLSGLNSEYIKEGILRFISCYYSSFYKTNAMIGFIIEKMDIESNVHNINVLIDKIYIEVPQNSLSKIKKESFIPNFKYHYSSIHKTLNNTELKLYHLMFDFSSCIVKEFEPCLTNSALSA